MKPSEIVAAAGLTLVAAPFTAAVVYGMFRFVLYLISNHDPVIFVLATVLVGCLVIIISIVLDLAGL